MVDYLIKLFTGYTTVKKNIGGIEFSFKYIGKPVFFDPLIMLREYSLRVSEGTVQKMELALSNQEVNSIFLNPEDNIQPSVICLSNLGGKELKVSRFTLKDGLHPLSLYRFELDGIVFGTFRRKYDYGSSLENLGLKLASLNQTHIELQKEKWLWSGKKGEKIFLEKFGHTQIWHLMDSDTLNFLKITGSN